MRSLLFGGSKRALGDPGDLLVPTRQPLRSTAGQPVTFNTALSVPAVWACVRIRADIISTLPVDVYLRRPGAPASPQPTPVILSTPAANNVDITEWLYASQVSLDLRGNAYGIIQDRDGLGFPRQIELVHPDAVSVNLRNGEWVYRIKGKRVPTVDVWHERQHVVPGSIVGLSPIQEAASSIGVALAAETYGAEWFGSGSHPDAILTNKDLEELEQKDAAIVKDRFLGSVQRGEPAVLAGGWQYQSVQLSPAEAQFIESQRWSLAQIARLFGVQPEMIGGEAGNSLVYANVEQRAIDFLTYGIGPTIARRERALSRLVPSRQYVKLNTGALLKTDLMTRYRAYGVGIGAHFLTPDEAREREELPPLTQEQKDELAAIQVDPAIAKGGPAVNATKEE
jgi:HK97 family phage portal protein